MRVRMHVSFRARVAACAHASAAIIFPRAVGHVERLLASLCLTEVVRWRAQHIPTLSSRPCWVTVNHQHIQCTSSGSPQHSELGVRWQAAPNGHTSPHMLLIALT